MSPLNHIGVLKQGIAKYPDRKTCMNMVLQWLTGACLAVVFSGCGNAPPPPLLGTVTLNGKSLPFAQVRLHLPDSRTAEATTDAAGNFLFTDAREIEGQEATVTVSCYQMKNGQPLPADTKPDEVASVDVAPEKYRSQDRSPLKVTVSAENRNLILNLTSAAESYKSSP